MQMVTTTQIPRLYTAGRRQFQASCGWIDGTGSTLITNGTDNHLMLINAATRLKPDGQRNANSPQSGWPYYQPKYDRGLNHGCRGSG